MHDVVIVGAGPVGGALALALADADLDIVALDARAAGSTLRGDRSLALSHGARLIFERLAVWPHLAANPGAVTPIVEIDISQAGGFGVTRLVAEEQGLPALGYVVSYRALQAAIDEALSRTGSRRPLRRHRGVGRRERPREASIALSGEAGPPLRARLAVVADGTGTAVSGIARQQRDYGQVALIAKVGMERAASRRRVRALHARGPDGVAARRRSLRPGVDDDAGEGGVDAGGIRRRVSSPRSRSISATRVTGFARVATAARFRCGSNSRGPRWRREASSSATPRRRCTRSPGRASTSACATRTNWARRSSARRATRWDRNPMLAAFAARRRPDRYAGIAFTHGLTQLFATDSPFVRWPRGLALALLDAMPPVKKAFTRAMLVRHVLNARSLAPPPLSRG